MLALVIAIVSGIFVLEVDWSESSSSVLSDYGMCFFSPIKCHFFFFMGFHFLETGGGDGGGDSRRGHGHGKYFFCVLMSRIPGRCVSRAKQMVGWTYNEITRFCFGLCLNIALAFNYFILINHQIESNIYGVFRGCALSRLYNFFFSVLFSVLFFGAESSIYILQAWCEQTTLRMTLHSMSPFFSLLFGFLFRFCVTALETVSTYISLFCIFRNYFIVVEVCCSFFLIHFFLFPPKNAQLTDCTFYRAFFCQKINK